MNTRLTLIAAALALGAALPAYAGKPVAASDPGRHMNPVKELAVYTGLTERRVQMILGCRTCFAEYRYTYHRSLEQFKRALGDERYQELMAGNPIELDRGERADRLAAADR